MTYMCMIFHFSSKFSILCGELTITLMKCIESFVFKLAVQVVLLSYHYHDTDSMYTVTLI